MGVRINVGGYRIEAIDYSVEEAATPLAAGDSGGAVGEITFEIPRPEPGLAGVPAFSDADLIYTEDPDDPGTFIPRS